MYVDGYGMRKGKRVYTALESRNQNGKRGTLTANHTKREQRK